MATINPIVARHVAAIVKVEHAGNLSSGSAFIDAFRAFAPIVASATKEDRRSVAAKLGTEFAMAYERASKSAAGDKARTVEEMKSIRSRCAAALMIGQRAWWPSAFDNLERMHKARHVGYTMVRDLLGAIAKLSDAPSLNGMEKKRAEIASGERNGASNGKAKRLINAAVPLDAMLSSLVKTGRWRVGGAKDAPAVPRDVMAHVNRAASELKTARTLIAAAIKAAKDAEA